MDVITSGLPLKIKIFMWQLSQDAVLTRHVMKKKKMAWKSQMLLLPSKGNLTTSFLYLPCC